MDYFRSRKIRVPIFKCVFFFRVKCEFKTEPYKTRSANKKKRIKLESVRILTRRRVSLRRTLTTVSNIQLLLCKEGWFSGVKMPACTITQYNFIITVVKHVL